MKFVRGDCHAGWRGRTGLNVGSFAALEKKIDSR